MDDVRNNGSVWQVKPSRQGDGSNTTQRLSPFGDASTVSHSKGVNSIATEGSYFVARNPTIGTGIAGIAAAATAADTETLFYLYNTATAAEGICLVLDYLRIVPTAAGTNGTTTQFYSWVDNTARYTSGGSSITPVNANMNSSAATKATCKFGALVTTAASTNKRTVGGGSLRLGVIKVIGDIYQFDFGGLQQDMPTVVTSGTAQAFVPWRHAPVVLGPGHAFGLEIYGASQTVAASFEFEAGWYER